MMLPTPLFQTKKPGEATPVKKCIFYFLVNFFEFWSEKLTSQLNWLITLLFNLKLSTSCQSLQRNLTLTSASEVSGTGKFGSQLSEYRMKRATDVQETACTMTKKIKLQQENLK